MEGQETAELHTQRPTVWIFCEVLSSSFSFPGRNIPCYIMFWKPTQIFVVTSPPTCYLHVAREHASSSMTSTQCTWPRFLLACQSLNLHGISAGDACILFILGTRRNFLLFFFPVSDFHCCKDMPKEVFKSISNICKKLSSQTHKSEKKKKNEIICFAKIVN